MVDHLYQVIGRTWADEDSLASGAAHLAAGGTPGSIAARLAHGDSWLIPRAAGQYDDALGRQPDDAGGRFWAERLRDGASEGWVGALIWGSPEAYRLAGSTAEGYVDRLYRRALRRDPDPAGRAFWVGEVRRAGRTRVAHVLLMTGEARGRRAGEVFETVLQRSPEQAARSYWAGRLTIGTELDLVAVLADAPELRSRAIANCGRPLRLLTDGTSDASPKHVSISADGRHVAAAIKIADSDVWDIVTIDLETDEVTRVTAGNHSSRHPDISTDGRFIVFTSGASNLVPAGSGPGWPVYVWDRSTGTTTRIGDEQIELRSYAPVHEEHGIPSISDDGDRIVVAGSTESTLGGPEVFMWERSTSTATMLTNDEDEEIGAPMIAGDGRHVLYSSYMWDEGAEDSHLVVLDLETMTHRRLVTGDHPQDFASISDDGSRVVFASSSEDIIPGDPSDFWHLYVWDSDTDRLTRVSRARTGAGTGKISGDGGSVVYSAYEGSNQFPVVIADLDTGAEIEVLPAGRHGVLDGGVSDGGRRVAAVTSLDGLVLGDHDGADDVYAWNADRWPLPVG